MIAFNRGGADTVDAGAGSDDTLTLGGGIAYADLRLRRSGQDLVLDAGARDAITFRGWYDPVVNRKGVVNLQMVADAIAGFDPWDRLFNRRVINFDFAGVVGLRPAQAANPGLTSFDVAGALAGCWVSGSDTAAIGGSLAYDGIAMRSPTSAWAPGWRSSVPASSP